MAIAELQLQFQPGEQRAATQQTIHSVCLRRAVIPTLYTQSPLFTLQIPQMPAADSVWPGEAKYGVGCGDEGVLVVGWVAISISIGSMAGSVYK